MLYWYKIKYVSGNIYFAYFGNGALLMNKYTAAALGMIDAKYNFELPSPQKIKNFNQKNHSAGVPSVRETLLNISCTPASRAIK